MKKIFLIFLSNIFLIIFLFFILDIISYQIIKIDHKKNHNWEIEDYGHNINKPYLLDCNSSNNCFSGLNGAIPGRKPIGLEYKSTPLVIFGCSFAYGSYLDVNQTLGYKLSEILKRPVYNRALPGNGLQGMFFQARSSNDINNKENIFYKFVPYSDTVIYVMIDDHYRRILVDFFDYQCKEINLRYILYKNKLKLINNRINIIDYIKSFYFIRFINHHYVQDYIYNKKNAETLTDLVLRYFIETRNELENKWQNQENKKLKFIIVFYDYYEIPYKEILRQKLEKNNFIVIDTDEITKEDLSSEKYNMIEKDNHPNETAWNLLVPLIIKKAEL